MTIYDILLIMNQAKIEPYSAPVYDALLRVHEALKVFQKKHRKWKKDLCGGCAVGSYLLTQELKEMGFNAEIRMTSRFKDKGYHCYVIIKEKRRTVLILDPTFSQFDKTEPIKFLEKTLDSQEFKVYQKYAKRPKRATLNDFHCWVRSQDPNIMSKKVLPYLVK